MGDTWRHRSRRIIRRVLAELGPRRHLKTKRPALRRAYPFGERKGRAYRVWCDEVRVQLRLRPPRRRYLEPPGFCAGQLTLFDVE